MTQVVTNMIYNTHISTYTHRETETSYILTSVNAIERLEHLAQSFFHQKTRQWFHIKRHQSH